jgi:SpoVK/Ycf46/Vps4 family AAA+-type ATPase
METTRTRTGQAATNAVAPTSADAAISLTIVAPGGNERFELPEVPTTMTPAAIAEQLTAEGYLPQLPSGQRYQLVQVSDTGMVHLDETLPLSGIGVGTGATLRALATTPGAASAASAEEAPAGELEHSPDPPLPRWLEQLEAVRHARTAHVVALFSNTTDYVFDGSRPPRRLMSYLASHLRGAGFRRLALMSVSTGLAWVEGTGSNPQPSSGEPSALLLALADELAERGDAHTAVLIENLEHFAPAGATDRETLKASELLATLAQDERLRASGCLIVATCRAPEALASSLLETTGAIHLLCVPLPSHDDRLRFLDYLASPATAVGLAPLADGLSRQALANLTQGVTLAGLDALNRDACASGDAISFARVRACKKEAIERQSRGLVEELDARNGFDAIGGLQHVISYLRTAVGHLREGRSSSAPKGVLLAGPPGTGKTLVAEALAREAGFNLVRIGDVRSMWVGESERNLSQVLRLLVELAPVVVFVDEVDQMVGGRDQGWNGDSGVSARLFARILNFMGRNEHRGRIIWVAATNRPDLLDEAMLRRFDRVFPFFVPGDRDRLQILRAMPAITGARYADALDLAPVALATAGLTGSAIEVVVRRAVELAESASLTSDVLLEAAHDYKPNHDAADYLRQSLLAFHAANLHSSIPPLSELPADLAQELTRLDVRSPR